LNAPLRHRRLAFSIAYHASASSRVCGAPEIQAHM
jgi:hypothetical protein